MNEQVITKDNIKKFTDQCFDKDNDKAASIVKGILDAKSPRISDISNEMEGNPSANYKTIQRFLDNNDPRENLHRLFDEDTEFIIGDPTEIHRPQAKKTEYVGKVGKSKQLGFWMLTLASPYKGRAIPFNFITYSSKTINDDMTSRNLEHRRAINELKELLGEKALVLDREFSYLELFMAIVAELIKFVIRLNTGNNPSILNDNGEKVSLLISQGETVIHRGVYYKGKVEVNLIGRWEKGLSEPIWVISNLPPEEALRIYGNRMKIDESFKDLKDLLSLEKIMNKKQENMEKMTSMVLFSYSIGLLIGEGIREVEYTGKKRKLYSGLFILLKRKILLSEAIIADIVNNVYLFFCNIILGNVRAYADSV